MSSITEAASPYPPTNAAVSASSVWRLMVNSFPELGLLSRILEQFAKRTPMRPKFSSQCRGVAGRANMKVQVTVEADNRVIAHIARCIEQIPGVKGVSLK